MILTASRALGLRLPAQKRWLSEWSSPAMKRSWDPNWTGYDPFPSKEYHHTLNIIDHEIQHATSAPARTL